ncbi:MAG: aminotransferase class I/II-fold pyridoxal phosphate-dependent enzyme [Saprospiraceae bacterium]
MYADLIPSKHIKINDENYLYFGGTSYLGIHANPKFGKLVMEGFNRYGTNYGASRLGVSIPVFDQMETKLADWIEASSCVLVSSGTLAGRLMLEVLGDEYRYHYATNAHVAIKPGYSKHQPHLFSCSIEDSLDLIHLSEGDKHVITFNSIDALTATIPDFGWISRLPKDKEIVLIIDDSHGIGVLGTLGKGMYEEIKKLHPNTIMIASLGKAMGLPAGVIAGPVQYTSLVRRHPLFGGSSPMVPAYADAYLEAEELYSTAYQKLISNIERLIANLKGIEIFTHVDGFPVFCTDRHELASYLELNKIKISHFAYPSPTDRLYTRIVLSALHSTDDLDRLTDLIKKF